MTDNGNFMSIYARLGQEWFDLEDKKFRLGKKSFNMLYG